MTTLSIPGRLDAGTAAKLPGCDRYENATPDKIWRHFPDATGTVHITGDNVTCALNVGSHHPSSSTPVSPASRSRSPGGTGAPCASASRHDDHQAPGNLNSIT
jgi:hypothetical protein